MYHNMQPTVPKAGIFCPQDERQIRLLYYLLPRFGHVGVEQMPIHIITTRTALLGCIFGLQNLSNLNKREAARAPLASV